MTIYSLHQMERYDFLNDANGLAVRNFFRDRDGEGAAGDWQPAEVSVEHRNKGTGPRQLARSDLWASCLPRLALTRAAAEALDEVLSRTGTLLPLVANDGQDLLLHDTQVVDCLDYERSNVRRFTSGRIMIITTAVFRSDLVEGLDLFHLPAGGRVAYASERFVEAVRASGLQGLDFEPCQVL